jgi:hypothetical protein
MSSTTSVRLDARALLFLLKLAFFAPIPSPLALAFRPSGPGPCPWWLTDGDRCISAPVAKFVDVFLGAILGEMILSRAGSASSAFLTEMVLDERRVRPSPPDADGLRAFAPPLRAPPDVRLSEFAPFKVPEPSEASASEE